MLLHVDGKCWIVLALTLACVPENPATSDGSGTSSATSTSTTGPPPCQSDADCPSVCVNGQCVECTTDADCSNPTPICVGEVCQGCSAPGQCPPSAPICDVASCVPCSDDAQCQTLGFDICIEAPAPDAGTCSGCSSNADCPPEYPECIAMQCTVTCVADPWENFEPLTLGDHLAGNVIEGFVCQSDLTDEFVLPISGPAFVSLELVADTKPGNVNLELLDDGNVTVAASTVNTGLDVIHVRVTAAADYRVRVSLASGPAGAPYKLAYRTLRQ